MPTTVRVNGTPATNIGFVTGSKTQVQADATVAAGTTATVYVAGATDEADLAMDLYNGSFTAPAADVTKPTVTSITQVAQDTVRVVFSEALDPNADFVTGDVKVLKGTTVYTNGAGAAITVTKYAADTTGKSYDVKIDLDTNVAGDQIYATGAASQALTFLFDKEVVADAAGNKNDEITSTVTLTRDATAPAFVSSKISSDKEKFEITFNEDIDATVNKNNIIVTDASGVRYTVDSAAQGTDPKVLVIDTIPATATSQVVADGVYTIKLGAGTVKDAQGNLSAEFTTNVTVGTAGDTTKPVPTISTTANNKFKVVFKNGTSATAAAEEVTASALSLSNYKLDGAALPAGTDIYFTDATKSEVEIVLPANSVNIGKAGVGTNAVLTVSGVADKAGNVSDAKSGDVTVEDNTAATLTSAQLLADTLVLTFSENIDAASKPADFAAVIDDFNISAGSTTLANGAGATGAATTSVDGNKLTITFTAGDSNWATVKAGALKVKTATPVLTDANAVVVKDEVEVTVTK
ncbi:hypothetical protein [Brevibacillus sp. HB2.2]|uniref:hypothetical protein n=1 Tax=Brevibacillus sp. HB2.2 TaxID=2738846 RepID=UPI00156A94C2|nr:hypothetical protein [Brevibacillus sp. HB2.2]NRS49422.1 hypothetical protein [Brevibacillus sp. HB2.2]